MCVSAFVCVVCVCVCVCARARLQLYNWPNLSFNICIIFFTPHNILWALFLCSCFVANYFHIFTMFLLFLCILLTKMAGMLAPIPKPHTATATSKSGYPVDTVISKQPIQREETAIWTAVRLPHNSIMMPLSIEPTEVAPM